MPGYTAYCASKHGVIGFTRALALETLKRKITVNAIAPGWVDTDMATLGMTQGATHAKISFDEFKDRQISAVPIKRIIDPAEVAALVKFLCSPGRLGDYRPDLQHLRRPDDGLEVRCLSA